MLTGIFSTYFSIKSPNIKFHENSYSKSRVFFPWDRQTDRHDVDNCRFFFCNVAKVPKNNNFFPLPCTGQDPLPLHWPTLPIAVAFISSRSHHEIRYQNQFSNACSDISAASQLQSGDSVPSLHGRLHCPDTSNYPEFCIRWSSQVLIN